MFGIGGMEFALIALIALLLLGPDNIPAVARKAGKMFADFKRYQESIESVVKAEWDAGGTQPGSGKADADAPALQHTAPPTAFIDDEEDEEEEE